MYYKPLQLIHASWSLSWFGWQEATECNFIATYQARMLFHGRVTSSSSTSVCYWYSIQVERNDMMFPVEGNKVMTLAGLKLVTFRLEVWIHAHSTSDIFQHNFSWVCLKSFYLPCLADDHGRYRFEAQPEICKWNLLKLAEAIKDVLPLERSMAALEEM